MTSAPETPSWLQVRRERAARRKSKWNLLLLVFGVLAVAAAWIGSVEGLARYRVALYPHDAFLSGGTRFGNILMYLLPFFPSLAAGFIVANLLIWCVPPARRALDEEDKQFPGLDFRSSNRDLTRFGLILLVATLPLAWLGARNCWSLTNAAIIYRPMFWPANRQYSWADVRGIRTDCGSNRSSTTYDFVAIMTDHTSVDLSSESPDEFLAAYPRIQTALAGSAYQFSCNCVGQIPSRWREILFRRPTQAQ
jgi:hypothetical protein